jgi:nicotinamide mononucleotide adenylyltransferase
MNKLKKPTIRYAISIGRRAPMHLVHLDCLQEIKAAGLQPVIIIGSANTKLDKYYDPVRNPLTIKQQHIQLQKVLGEEYQPQHIYTLDDQDDESWLAQLSSIVDHYDKQIIFHYRTKLVEKTTNVAEIRSLSSYLEIFTAKGWQIWQTYNKKAEFDNIHASDLRKMDLLNLTAAERKIFAAPELIIEMAAAARDKNPDKDLLKDMPITMLDMSLERLYQEAGISTFSLLRGDCN